MTIAVIGVGLIGGSVGLAARERVGASVRGFDPGDGVLDAALEREVYGQPSLIPASPWLGKARLPKPTLSVVTGERAAQLKISWTSGEAGAARLWLLQTRTGSEWTTEILPATKTSRMWNSSPPEVIALSAVDFNGNLSPAASVAQTRK